ncbi:hypothetical protein XENTR_v10009039 [Xenopus tropicalis]|nr:hypothetical protein XENTR_v10009039 [Xenopus tropicalis]
MCNIFPQALLDFGTFWLACRHCVFEVMYMVYLIMPILYNCSNEQLIRSFLLTERLSICLFSLFLLILLSLTCRLWSC